MPRGDKSEHTDKQDRKADHIAQGYEKRGVAHEEAERRAWATVNKESGGGKKSGSGHGRPESHASSRKGGKLGGRRRRAGRQGHARAADVTRLTGLRLPWIMGECRTPRPSSVSRPSDTSAGWNSTDRRSTLSRARWSTRPTMALPRCSPIPRCGCWCWRARSKAI